MARLSKKASSKKKVVKGKKERAKVLSVTTISNFTYHWETRFLEKYVVCRGYYAGIHAGMLIGYDRENSSVILKDARRLWRWDSDFTLSEVAVKGLTGGKIAVVTPVIYLKGIDEILPCTEEGEKSIREAPVYVVPEGERPNG
jgi:hypothetical protein